MALANYDFLKTSADDIFPKQLRVVVNPGGILNRLFAAGSGTLERLTPLARDGSGNLIPWSYLTGVYTEGTSEVIVGFVYRDEVELLAAGETNGNVLVNGSVDYRDVVLLSGEVQSELEEALQQLSLRQRNLTITGGLSTNL